MNVSIWIQRYSEVEKHEDGKWLLGGLEHPSCLVVSVHALSNCLLNVKLVLTSVLVAHLYLKQKISSSHSFTKHLLSSCFVPGSLPGSGYDTGSKAQLLTTKSSWSTPLFRSVKTEKYKLQGLLSPIILLVQFLNERSSTFSI